MAEVFRQVPPLLPADLVRGQFRGYRDEQGIASDSTVETFAALRLEVDSWRWEGVPFLIRTGKCLPVSATEVTVQLRRPPLSRLTADGGNHFRLRLDPDLDIALGARVKKPGDAMKGEPTELSLVSQPHGDDMSAYERLLGDAMSGDTTHFARQNGVEAAWAIVVPVLGDATPVEEYEPGSWGPSDARRLAAKSGGWIAPRGGV